MSSQATLVDSPSAPDAVDATAEALSVLSRLSKGTSADVFARQPNPRQRSRCIPLLPELCRIGDGAGPEVALDTFRGRLLVVTLGITDVMERTGLTVSVWGSADQVDWGTRPLLTFRERQYCGVYSVLLNLAARPDIKYLRTQWTMNRWGRGERLPAFGFEVFVDESGARVGGPAAA